MKRIYTVLLVILPFVGNAQIPNGYYDDAEGLAGDQLRESLHDIIDNHDSQSYGSLWNHFQSTDEKSNGKVWDMYSTRADGTFDYEYTFGSDQCGNYSGEGSCYNREHSVPGSWYNDASPMYTDLFHLYPTDGWVNGIRSNHPFGEVQNPSVTTTNGSKRGANTFPGYTGMVFEPIDEFKGDFARTYFYVATRYMDVMSNWNTAAFNGNNLAEWQMNMMLEWHEEDPVSQKEINRNNRIYSIQENRNPYIDHPEWVELIWESTIEEEEEEEPTSVLEHSTLDLSLDFMAEKGKVKPFGNWKELQVYSASGQLIYKTYPNEVQEYQLMKNQLVIIKLIGDHNMITRKIIFN